MVKKFSVINLIFLLFASSVLVGGNEITQSDSEVKTVVGFKFNGVIENMITDSQGYVYFILANFSSNVQKLYCLHPNGSVKWSMRINNSGPLVGGPVLDAQGNIYLTTDPGIPLPMGTPFPVMLYSIKPDGHIGWKINLGYVGRTMPVIGPNNTVFVNTGEKLYAIHSNGTFRDVYNLTIKSYGPYFSNNTLYLFTDNSVYAITTDFRSLWSHQVNSSPLNIVLDDAGYAYVCLKDGSVLALNNSGISTWFVDYGAEELIGILNKSVLGVAFESNSTSIYAFEEESGEILWFAEINGSYPLQSFADSHYLYISTYNYENKTSNIYRISENGEITPIWFIPSLVTSITAYGEEIIYIGTQKGDIYVLGTPMEENNTPEDDAISEGQINTIYIITAGSVAAVLSIAATYSSIKKRGNNKK